MKKLTFSILVVVSFAFISCENEIIIPDLPDTVSFSNDIAPWFSSKCVGCHGPSSSSGLDLSSDVAYDNLFTKNLIDIANPSNSGLYTKLQIDKHAGTSSTDAAKVLKWIEQGALNN
jgi:hypothetical protein